MDPRLLYLERRTLRSARAARLERRQLLWSRARLATALAGVALFWFVFVHLGASPAWMALPIVVFVALAIRQDQELRQLREAARAAPVL